MFNVQKSFFLPGDARQLEVFSGPLLKFLNSEIQLKIVDFFKDYMW